MTETKKIAPEADTHAPPAGYSKRECATHDDHAPAGVPMLAIGKADFPATVFAMNLIRMDSGGPSWPAEDAPQVPLCWHAFLPVIEAALNELDSGDRSTIDLDNEMFTFCAGEAEASQAIRERSQALGLANLFLNDFFEGWTYLATQALRTEARTPDDVVEALERRAATAEHRLYSFRQHRAARSRQLNEFVKSRAPELWPDYAAISVNGASFDPDAPNYERELNILEHRAEAAKERATKAEAALAASGDARTPDDAVDVRQALGELVYVVANGFPTENALAQARKLIRKEDIPTTPAPDVVEAACRAACKADGRDWDEVCAYEADPDAEGCDSWTCVASYWEDHLPDEARAQVRKMVIAALTASGDARERALREAIKAAANIGYVTCAKARHVTLGGTVKSEILALLDTPTPAQEGGAE